VTDSPTGPELFETASAYVLDINSSEARDDFTGMDDRLLYAALGQVHATQALTAALVMMVDAQTDGRLYELEAWRDAIPRPPLKECRSKEARRPECAERHTQDCDYADPPPEPKHVLLDVGTRVLFSEPVWDENAHKIVWENPKVGKIAGYDMGRTKYRISEECYGRPGEYYDFHTWAFVDNRVQVHPDGPGDPAPRQAVKREPTGPRVYVEDRRGKQGHLLEVKHDEEDGSLWYSVQYYTPGAGPVWKRADSLAVIAASQVQRCPNGQTGDECGSGENQCELCLADEDAEAEAIEGSMGV
jgi:hypothetical protein